MLIDWGRDFGAQLDRMEADTTEDGKARLDLLTALLGVLTDLVHEPTEESPSLKRVRQSRRYQVWRVAHPYRTKFALRLICWFPPDDDRVVVTLFAGDKAAMGDVFYDSVGTRSDQAIDRWMREREADDGGA